MSSILVMGSDGQLGSEFKAISASYPFHAFTFIGRADVDLSNTTAIKEYFLSKEFDFIINCAAYTAVDKAQSESKLADAINHKAVKALAFIAKEKNIALVHISTDYVFDGKNYRPYIESDPTNPLSVYGKTKLDGENDILAVAPANSVIIRTSWVYSSYGANFVKTMLRLAKERETLSVVYDQVGTPTYARDLAKTVIEIIPKIQNSKVEIYNYSNEGVLSWYDFAKEIMKMAKLSCAINPIETKDYPTLAIRPHYSIMNKSKIKNSFGVVIPYWKDSLSECLKLLGEKR